MDDLYGVYLAQWYDPYGIPEDEIDVKTQRFCIKNIVMEVQNTRSDEWIEYIERYTQDDSYDAERYEHHENMNIRWSLYLEYEQGAQYHRIDENPYEYLKNELDSRTSFHDKISPFLDMKLPLDETIERAFFIQKWWTCNIIYGVFSRNGIFLSLEYLFRHGDKKWRVNQGKYIV